MMTPVSIVAMNLGLMWVRPPRSRAGRRIARVVSRLAWVAIVLMLL